MTNLQYLYSYLITLITFLGIDSIWLTQVAPKFYQSQIGALMKKSPNLIAAFIFYLLFVMGLLYFVILPNMETKNISKIIISGALFGLITYATYDLTNLAVTKDWPVLVTIVDMIWGTLLTALVSLVSYLLIQKFILH